MARIYLYYTYRDSKSEVGRNEISLPFSLLSAMNKVMTYAVSLALLIDAVTKCQIISGGICAEIDIGSIVGLKNAPIEGADVEEGGKFIFKSSTGGFTSTRIPGFDEAFVDPTSKTIPIIADVSDLCVAIISGQTVSGTLIAPSDNRGDDITVLYSAKESFQASRV
jgi:hypothetical protein